MASWPASWNSSPPWPCNPDQHSPVHALPPPGRPPHKSPRPAPPVTRITPAPLAPSRRPTPAPPGRPPCESPQLRRSSPTSHISIALPVTRATPAPARRSSSDRWRISPESGNDPNCCRPPTGPPAQSASRWRPSCTIRPARLSRTSRHRPTGHTGQAHIQQFGLPPGIRQRSELLFVIHRCAWRWGRRAARGPRAAADDGGRADCRTPALESARQWGGAARMRGTGAW
jgi:hypothetical protein